MTDVHNYENFGRFKSLSKGTTAAAAETKYDSWSVNGDDPSGPGSPELNADGTQKFDSAGKSTGNTKKKANAKTQRWGDQETYQVGNKYDELEGDAVTNVVGNTTTLRQGWTNNVTHGLTFSTQLGGTVTTSLSFGLTVQIGLKCSVFAGIEASINASKAIKLNKGDNYTWDTASKNEFGDQKIESDRKKLEIADDHKKVINDEIAVYAQGVSVVAGGDIASVCKSHSTTCVGDITLDSADTINITGMKNVSIAGGKSLTLESVSQVIVSAPAKVTIGGALINIG